MISLQILRVHVAPVGFEVDRIVLPAINMKADRVWLVVHDKAHEDKGDKFVKAIQSRLRDARIDCLQAQADRIDLFDILRALRTIFLREKENSLRKCINWQQNPSHSFYDGVYDVQRPWYDKALLCST